MTASEDVGLFQENTLPQSQKAVSNKGKVKKNCSNKKIKFAFVRKKHFFSRKTQEFVLSSKFDFLMSMLVILRETGLGIVTVALQLYKIRIYMIIFLN